MFVEKVVLLGHVACEKKKVKWPDVVRRVHMNTFQYIVESIDGDYAHLRRIDEESDELKLVARALLPPEIVEGSKLLYEWMQYSIIE